MSYSKISIIAAFGHDRKRNRVIGNGNELLWHIPEDLKRFKAITSGHPIIMGRKTFDSIVAILGKPLPNRTNIVVTRNKKWAYESALSAPSIEKAIDLARLQTGGERIFIGGGGEIYAQSLSLVDKLYLTVIEDEKEGDSFFPAYEHLFKKSMYREGKEWNGIKYTWIDLERDSTK